MNLRGRAAHAGGGGTETKGGRQGLGSRVSTCDDCTATLLQAEEEEEEERFRREAEEEEERMRLEAEEEERLRRAEEEEERLRQEAQEALEEEELDRAGCVRIRKFRTEQVRADPSSWLRDRNAMLPRRHGCESKLRPRRCQDYARNNVT